MNLQTAFDAFSLETLHGYLSVKQEENLQLEFKTLGEPDMRSGEDKKNLARMLSGFSNSSGGLIVWGVDARRNDDGVDCASELKPIPRVATLLTRLNELDGTAANPVISGVRHKTILRTPGADDGYAVTLVPESETGPHMAKMGEDRYYKRSGHRLYIMEHFDIADMFGRRLRPKLVLTTRVRSNGSEIIFGLRNDGRALAHAPYLAIRCPPPFRRSVFGVDGNRNEPIRLAISDSGNLAPWQYSASADFVIHPGVTIDIGCLTSENNNTPLAAEGLILDYEIACDGVQLYQGRSIIPRAQLNSPR